MTQDNKRYILKTLVGSHAHGLAGPKSDYDYRGVYVLPTKDILSLGYNYKGSHWLEGEQDQTAYEIGHFLHLATKCNPTILEVMVAPIQDSLIKTYKTGHGDLWNIGAELRTLLPYCWNPQDAFNAFVGYALNQRKKMLDNHLDRWHKYGVAYLRTLWNLCDLLETGTFNLEVKDPVFKIVLVQIRNQELTSGQIIDYAEALKIRATKALQLCNHKQDVTKVNEFLLKVRKEFWE